MKPSTVDRPLDLAEHFFWLADRVSSLNFVMFAELDGELDPLALRGALDRAQRAHPLLRVRIVAGDGVPRFVPAEGQPIPLQAIQVAADAWQAPIERELRVAFRTGEAPLMRCTYAALPNGKQSVLALTFHHAIADGRSGAALLRRILGDVLAGVQPASGADPVNPPLHELFPPAYRWDDHPDAAEAVYEQQMALLARHGPVLPMPWLQGPPAPLRPGFERVVLESDATDALVRQCRSKGATVHGAIGAAELLALHRLWGRPGARTWLLSHPVDLRGHLARAVPPDCLGLYISVLSSPHQVDDDSDFWALAREVTADLRLQLTRGEAHLFYATQGLDQAPPRDEGVAWFGKRLRALLPNVALSNIGRIEPIPADERVRAISFALCPMPFQLAFCAASTYAGRLLLNLTYDAARLPPADAARFAQDMQRRIVAETVA
jgi:NRPS condensation-like uncharacterized protein